MAGEEKEEFNAFTGVFVPTFLSIIGVILFLRLGFIVGSIGVLGTFIIILLAVSVIVATGLSLSSITTNIRIGSGGAYSIISKTLGLEVGGSVGIPLYLAQVFSIALYLFGFVEAWTFIFPSHSELLITAAVFLVVTGLTAISTKIAVKTQVFVFLIVLASLASILLGGSYTPLNGFSADVGQLFQSNFWPLFALFFPATTGLMAGIGLSGKLEDPKSQIPKGVLWAIGVTTSIYLVVTIWLGSVASSEVLINNSQAIVEYALIPGLVLVGILAATFSSALTTAVAAPRLLTTMAENRVIPYDAFFSKKTKQGEPLRAAIFTAAILLLLLFVGSLDRVAPFLTIFFLITYAAINLVVFLEQSLGSVTFRPTLKIPKLVPLYGAVSSSIFMFLISPITGIVSFLLLGLIYTTLIRRNLTQAQGDVRSGIFRNVAEWAAQKIVSLPESTKHTWKPNILLPVITTRTLLGNFPVIQAIANPNGTMNVLGLKVHGRSNIPEQQSGDKAKQEKELDELPKLLSKFHARHLFTSSTIVSVNNYTNGICVSLEAMEGQVFHPNILFLGYGEQDLDQDNIQQIFTTCNRTNVGLILLDKDHELGLGTEQDIHLWLPEEVLEDDIFTDHLYDLAMIIAYRLYLNWDGNLNMYLPVENHSVSDAKRYVHKLLYEARFPHNTEAHVAEKSLKEAIKDAPNGDVHILPINGFEDLKAKSVSQDAAGKTFLYVMDSTKEDILG